MTRSRAGVLHALAVGGAVCLVAAGCSDHFPEEEPLMTSTGQRSAAETWDLANARAESTQAFVAGAWSAIDSAARACGTDGARWVIGRLGPGTTSASREDVVAAIRAHWQGFGWEPTRSTTSGDAPSTRLRYPAGRSLDDGFFVDFETTVHGSTLTLQTACAPGDAGELNRTRYGEHHRDTPPFAGSHSPGVDHGGHGNAAIRSGCDDRPRRDRRPPLELRG